MVGWLLRQTAGVIAMVAIAMLFAFLILAVGIAGLAILPPTP